MLSRPRSATPSDLARAEVVARSVSSTASGPGTFASSSLEATRATLSAGKTLDETHLLNSVLVRDPRVASGS